MTRSNSIARGLHDLGAAGWFGGTLMGATAANRAVSDASDADQRGAVINGIWRRWWPVNAACIGAHLIGGALLTVGNRERIAGQRGVATMSATKTALTVAACGASAYGGLLGKKISDAGDVPVEDGTNPSNTTPADTAQALRQQQLLQWVIPALTGALIVVSAAMGEQQRPGNVLSGVVSRITPGG